MPSHWIPTFAAGSVTEVRPSGPAAATSGHVRLTFGEGPESASAVTARGMTGSPLRSSKRNRHQRRSFGGKWRVVERIHFEANTLPAATTLQDARSSDDSRMTGFNQSVPSIAISAEPAAGGFFPR